MRGLAVEGTPVEVDVETDLTQMAAVRAEVAKHTPNTVIFAGAWDAPRDREVDMARAFARNAEAVINLAAAALEFKAVPILLSTADVFEGSGGPWSESDTPEPSSEWATSRVKGEQFLLRAAKNGVVLRTGPILEDGLTAFRRAYEAQTPTPENEWVSPVGAADLGRAIRAIRAAELKGVVHVIGGGPAVTRAELLRSAVSALGLDPARVVGASGRARKGTLLADRMEVILPEGLSSWSEALKEAAGFVENAPADAEGPSDISSVSPSTRVYTPQAESGAPRPVAMHSEHRAVLHALDDGHRCDFRQHHKYARTLHVLSGKLLVEVESGGETEDHILKAGTSIEIAARVTYRFTAVNPTQLLEIGGTREDDTTVP